MSAAIVVEEATDKKHPLHNRFLWDNAAAAHEFRLGQASELIRSVRVAFVEGGPADVGVRQWHAVRRDGSYQPIEEIVRDEVSLTTLLRQAEREWKTLQARYGHLAEFVTMVREAVA